MKQRIKRKWGNRNYTLSFRKSFKSKLKAKTFAKHGGYLQYSVLPTKKGYAVYAR